MGTDDIDDDGTQTEGGDSKDFANLRRQHAATQAELAATRAQLKKVVLEKFGEVGPKLVESWNPEKLEDFTTDSFKAHAAEYGVNFEESAPAGSTQATEAEQNLDQTQALGDALRNGSTQSNASPTREQQIAEAEAKDDWKSAGALKDQLILEKAGIKLPA